MIFDIGLTYYEDAYKMQKELVARRRLGEIGDSLIITEHRSVFTIGRNGSRAHIIADEELLARHGIEVLDADRGGDITFHGPGQLVIYPIIDLRGRIMDLHKYLRDLEKAAIIFLEGYSVKGARMQGKTGVWVGDKKIASVGIAASNWITFHGLALNVNVDLKFFDMIYPCGMKTVRMVSLARLLGRYMDMDVARSKVISAFCSVFNLGESEIAQRHACLA